jgi:hypothetical protein
MPPQPEYRSRRVAVLSGILEDVSKSTSSSDIPEAVSLQDCPFSSRKTSVRVCKKTYTSLL